MRMRVNRRAAHRTTAPIIVSPDAQPAFTSAAAAGERILSSPSSSSPSLLCLLRARDLPRFDFGWPDDRFRRPDDLALLAVAVLTALRLRARRTLPSPWLLTATAAFALLIVASSIPNGAAAFIAAGKLAEFVRADACAALLIREDGATRCAASLIVAYTVVAAFWGAVGFVRRGGGRQGSFLGEHDLAASGRWPCRRSRGIHARGARPGALRDRRIAAGSLGVTLGASLASLLGLYLAVGAVMGLAARAA